MSTILPAKMSGFFIVMSRTETIRGRDQSIFPSHTSDGVEIKISLHWQNIHHVLPGVSPQEALEIEGHYGPRAGALDWSRREAGILVRRKTSRVCDHAAYLSGTAIRALNVYELKEIQNGHHPANTLVVPYIHTSHTQADIRALGQESWGLPPEMVTKLKNKVNFHEIVRDSQVGGFEIPDYRIANLDTLERESIRVLNEAQDLYTEHDMSNTYPLGVVIRADESDGNYGGNVIIYEKTDGIHVIINSKPITEEVDGKETEKIYRNGNWRQAIKEAKRILDSSFNRDANPQFVVTRFMDIVDSPGLSIVINKGDEESLGWNGQIQQEGTMACRGTERYQPDNPHLKRLQAIYEEKTTDDFIAFIKETAKKWGISYEEISGIVNVDIMLPGPREAELRRKMGKEYGYYVAESNARFTNYTDGVLAVTGLTNRYPSPREIQKIVWEGVTTIDGYDLRGADVSAVRDEMYELDQLAYTHGWGKHRAFMRMPDNPAGMILTGDKKLASARIEKAIDFALDTERKGRTNLVVGETIKSVLV